MSQATQLGYDRIKIQTQVSPVTAFTNMHIRPLQSLIRRTDQDMGRIEPWGPMEELTLQANRACDG